MHSTNFPLTCNNLLSLRQGREWLCPRLGSTKVLCPSSPQGSHPVSYPNLSDSSPRNQKGYLGTWANSAKHKEGYLQRSFQKPGVSLFRTVAESHQPGCLTRRIPNSSQTWRIPNSSQTQQIPIPSPTGLPAQEPREVAAATKPQQCWWGGTSGVLWAGCKQGR